MEILTSLQKEILSLFPAVPESSAFYLTGGTALAEFYLQHRKSNDLDFFTATENIITLFSFQLEAALKERRFTLTRARGLLSFIEIIAAKENDSTLIHLAQDAPFRFAKPAKFNNYPQLNVDSLADIASNKLLALFQRATLRDFIDVYFLVTEKHFTKEQLMDLAKEKDAGFDLYWLGVALEQIKKYSAETADMLMLVKPCIFQELAAFFDQWRGEITRQLL